MIILDAERTVDEIIRLIDASRDNAEGRAEVRAELIRLAKVDGEAGRIQ